MALERSRDPHAFSAFERSGWNANIRGYDDAFGEISRQTVEAVLGAPEVRDDEPGKLLSGNPLPSADRRLGDPYRRRFVASAMLRSPGGMGGGNVSGAGRGGSSFARIALRRRTRGDNGKRSAAIVSRNSAARIALSSSRSGVIAEL